MDAAVIALSAAVALGLFTALEFTSFYRPPALYLLAGAAALHLPLFYVAGVYRVLWQYSNVRDMYRLLGAVAACLPVLIAAGRVLDGTLPWGAFFVASLLIGVGCVLYRSVIRDVSPVSKALAGPREVTDPWGVTRPGEEKRILIAGAGDAGRMILSEYARRGMEAVVAGFVDDNPEKIGRVLNGKKVFASTENIGGVVESKRITELIIAMPSVESRAVERIIMRAREAHPGLVLKTLPPFTRIFESSLSPDLRELGIGDLLGREEFSIDAGAIKDHFAGRTVLVTGAGGSIGSELCRQLLKFDIRGLVALGRGEFSIYSLAKSLNEYLYFLESAAGVHYRIADVRDTAMLGRVFDRYRPDIVIHAAAHKHVPLMEYNEIEAVSNNVIGSANVFEACRQYGAGECVLVSTDKAVRPVNVMGATKRMAELVARYYGEEKNLKTSIVRFGNVIGSRGSVIPLFREQIEKGGPVTVTHPEVTRYFMSIPEASILVLNAAAYADGGEIFALDMGRQYRVADVARQLIRLYGLEPDRDIRVEFTGLRPGEKLYEELFYGRERLRETGNEKIFTLDSSAEGFDSGEIRAFLEKAPDGLYRMDALQVRRLIKDMVPEYEFEPPPAQGGRNRVVN